MQLRASPEQNSLRIPYVKFIISHFCPSYYPQVYI